MSGHRSPRRSAARILTLPTLIALLTFAGLIIGLLGDGLNDGVAWLGIGLPVLVIAYHWMRSRRHGN